MRLVEGGYGGSTEDHTSLFGVQLHPPLHEETIFKFDVQSVKLARGQRFYKGGATIQRLNAMRGVQEVECIMMLSAGTKTMKYGIVVDAQPVFL